MDHRQQQPQQQHQQHQHHHMPPPRQIHDQKHALLQQQPGPSLPTLPPSEPASAAIFDRLDRPFKLPLYPPPPAYAQTHDSAAALSFADQNTELPPIQPPAAHGDDNNKPNSLPSLSSLTSSSAPLYPPSHPQEPAYSPPAPPPPTHWPSLNPLTAYYNPSHAQGSEPPLRMDIDASSSSGVSAASSDRLHDGRASSVSLDDPDVRMAAEALGDLRADFVSSPSGPRSPLPGSPRSQVNGTSEPLISLLTTSHPLLATTIEGATSAYVNSKNYSPRFKTSAEYVEGYVIPIANTVGSVGRVTGVEDGVRWFLRRHQSHGSECHGSDLEAHGRGSNKRRRVDSGAVARRDSSPEPGSGAQTPRASLDLERRLSVASTVDTLPAYDDMRSPPYAEHFVPPDGRSHENRPHGAWQSRLIMSTSGLSIAMSEESLRSLKYCLGWLRWANVHIGNIINSLKTTMDKYEQAKSDSADGDHHMQGTSSDRESMDRSQLAAKITLVKSDVLKTLQEVINTVSRYAGGALPENARELVRRHLTSLPQRFRVASMVGSDSQKQNGHSTASSEEEGREVQEKETRENAQRVLLLAKEGLDMMCQVSGVLNGTIESAEEWCERLGRKKREQREDLLGVSSSSSAPLEEVKTG